MSSPPSGTSTTSTRPFARSPAAAANLVTKGGPLKSPGAGATINRLFSVGPRGGAIDSSGASALNFNSPGSMAFNGQAGARPLPLPGTAGGTFDSVIGDNGGA